MLRPENETAIPSFKLRQKIASCLHKAFHAINRVISQHFK
ncbi:MAG: hypothetical protein GQF41_0453 [Candidatus Rifleibacterium amylolyticum]|nr:MAG: hypothetical protein GQF41_0453 [Candidatus Rifleibacterium amylolyticum]